jgi:hypothetical protein
LSTAGQSNFSNRPIREIDRRNIMAFVNEYVSAEDVKKYDLDGINRKFGKDPEIRYQWTIDRANDFFLMWMSRGREEFAGRQTFVFWWKGEVLPVYMESEGSGRLNEKTTTIWRSAGIELPPQLAGQREEITQVLKEALTAYKVSGIGVPVADHTAMFEF